MNKDEANVSFSRVAGTVEMVLRIGDTTVTRSPSQESIARELQIHGVTKLTLENKFTIELPTSPKTLVAAGSIPFTELMTALKLLAACAYTGEPYMMPSPERRAIPRAKKLFGEAWG